MRSTLLRHIPSLVSTNWQNAHMLVCGDFD
jgi:hypothetical protein